MNSFFIKIILLFAVFLPCFAFVAEEGRLNFSFDNRKWKRAFENSNPQATIVEFTLRHENVDDWTELVTLQKLPPTKNSVQQFYIEFINNLKLTAGADRVQTRIINKSNDHLFFEWWIKGNDALAQHEWFKVIKTPHSLLTIRYTTKKVNDIEKVRPQWEKIIDEASYVNSSNKNSSKKNLNY